MPIRPFKDRPKIPIGVNVDVNPGTTGSMITVPPRYKQGVSVSNMKQYGRKLLPQIGDDNFSYRVLKTGGVDHRHVTLNFGQTSFWKYPGDYDVRPVHSTVSEHPGSAGAISPYEDMVGIFRGKDFITDPGTMIYPEVLFNRSLITTAVMDGIIEPLAVRDKMNMTNSEGPFNAHDIRADIYVQDNIGAVEEGSSPVCQYKEFIESYMPAFIDSSDNILTISVPGIADFGFSDLAPFDDAMNLNGKYVAYKTLSDKFETKLYDFIHSDAIFAYSMPAGYYYIKNIAGASEINQVTGEAFVLGTDSIAFGGFRR